MICTTNGGATSRSLDKASRAKCSWGDPSFCTATSKPWDSVPQHLTSRVIWDVMSKQRLVELRFSNFFISFKRRLDIVGVDTTPSWLTAHVGLAGGEWALIDLAMVDCPLVGVGVDYTQQHNCVL